MERGIQGIGVSGPARAAIAAEVERQDPEPGRLERAGLLSPARLVEAAAVREDDAAVAFPVGVGEEEAAVLGRERDELLRLERPEMQHSGEKRGEKREAPRRAVPGHRGPGGLCSAISPKERNPARS